MTPRAVATCVSIHAASCLFWGGATALQLTAGHPIVATIGATLGFLHLVAAATIARSAA